MLKSPSSRVCGYSPSLSLSRLASSHSRRWYTTYYTSTANNASTLGTPSAVRRRAVWSEKTKRPSASRCLCFFFCRILLLLPRGGKRTHTQNSPLTTIEGRRKHHNEAWTCCVLVFGFCLGPKQQKKKYSRGCER